MEMKEVLIRVWEKMNCKEMLEKYSVSTYEYRCGDTTELDLNFEIPHPTKSDPDYTKCRRIQFIHSKDSSGFGYGDSRKVQYTCTEKEAIEIQYIFHQIKCKLEEIRRDELLKFL